ncbi:DUF58 domain-containing protein [Thalassomonas sp. M1454]|uniref:DUF58 domain-containing protein n=1 Tax=Thalassomonas sp. M1454 TaxID=2594477 RepID=UPI00117CDD12|nr:DUF58 domain-containing protein [Thalassomonas sp. M1454]TRX54935.1 DUF58 domain-containing protein [Thalassomonas sp. M1454]
MNATNAKNKASRDDPNIYTSLDSLRRLQFKAQGFSFTPKQPINSILAGKNVSKLRGRGLNFEEMRQYHIGDDIRTMDWKVTVRTGKPHVKVYTEERERNVFLLVDQRQSMFFGSKGKMKSVIAAEIAALAAWKVLEGSDRVGGIIFNDDKSVTMPAKRSKHQVIQFLSEVTRQNQLLKSGDVGKEHHLSLEGMLEQLKRVIGHDALIMFITDGYGWNDKCNEYIKTITQHNEMIFCHVSDPLEHELATMQQMVISDGDMQIEVSSQKPELQKKFQQDVIDKLELFAKVAGKYRIPVLPFDTVTDTVKQMRKGLGL